jgi:LacI family transcriptional regulator
MSSPEPRPHDRPAKRISLVIDKNLSAGRKLLRGFLGFESARHGWVMHSVDNLEAVNLQRLKLWKPDGVLVGMDQVRWPAELDAAHVVSISSGPPDGPHPSVGIDQQRVGELGAQHFLERGFRDFAYFGDLASSDAQRQMAGYTAKVHEALPAAQVHGAPPLPRLDMSQAWATADESLVAWLSGLPRPVGLMLANDELGLWVLQLCGMAGLRVPDDVAVLGVNDDTLNCEMTTPPLSSIQVPFGQVGEEAARMLHALIRGEPVPDSARRLPPLGVTVRESTDVLAVKDEHLVAAVRFIEQSAHRPLGVEDVLDQVDISRRSLERLFRRHLGRTPLQEIRRAHIRRAKLLLTTTDHNLQAIADRSGFATTYHLCRTFRKETGQTAITYRKRHRSL